jgi:dipeptidyl aminopeptidase/acylaminoacyl peptidase
LEKNAMKDAATRRVAPFGAWRSPITPDAIVAESVRLGQVAIDGSTIYWIEGRPQERGRSVLVRRTADGTTHDITPARCSVRSGVHEYGGGSFVVVDGTVYFTDFADHALYRLNADGDATDVVVAAGQRFADLVFDAPRQRLIAVCEDHSGGGEPVTTLVAIDLNPDLGAEQGPIMLAAGADFYASPRLSPDGQQIAWLTWQHPNMPWDGTTLWLGRFDASGAIIDVVLVAGGVDESIFQPQWSPSGDLVFVSDRSGWWNLYRWRNGAAQPLYPVAAEFGEPQWEFAMSRYGFTADGGIVCSYIRNGDAYLARLDPDRGTLQEIPTPFREIKELQVGDGFVAFLGGSPSEARSLVRLDLARGQTEVLRRGSGLSVDPGYLSSAQAIAFPTTDGKTAHAFFYAARNHDYTAPTGDKPPLLVLSHGGPTSQATATFNPMVQFWTSRGFGVVDVNYGGSSGYGREYRRRLNGNWGIVDIDDCVNAARYLVTQGLADEKRLAIRGGSAGGYTTLGALTFRDYFKAGASYYGVGDLEVLARDTHKFESRYLDSLIGPYPEEKALYAARSPINATDRLSSALILFQGLEDKVVPPNQSQMMFDAVKKKGLPVAYLPFANEQHGFRAAATIKRCLEAELYFYGKVFGFTPADVIAPIVIENLPTA